MTHLTQITINDFTFDIRKVNGITYCHGKPVHVFLEQIPQHERKEYEIKICEFIEKNVP